jgi:hypothetical protein
VGRDGYTGLVLLAASAALFWATLGLERHPMVPVGPAFYPRIVLGITALLALMLLASDLLARRQRREAPPGTTRLRYGLVAAAFAVFTVYVLSLPYLGFRLATFLFMVAMQAALDPPRGARRWAMVAVIALATAGVTYYAFDQYLHVLLPRGRWTGF